MDRGMYKIVLIKRRTRLEELKRRYNTIEQAKFYVEHLGADFNDYILEHENYYAALDRVRANAEMYARVQEIDREYIPNMIFGKEDVVVAVGQDGLVANTMKYLDGQPLIGVNPDVKRWDGQLLPFEAREMDTVLPKVLVGNYSERKVTMGKAETKDGQVLYSVIISTGLGMTGWHRSVMAEFQGMARAFNMGEIKMPEYQWDSGVLVFQVREPYPSRFTEAGLVYGEVGRDDTLTFVSNMAENGIVFSDGILEDSIEFNAGMELKISVSERSIA